MEPESSATRREIGAPGIRAPVPVTTRGGQWWFWLLAGGCALTCLAGVALLAGFFYLGSVGPNTDVYAGNEVPSRFLDTMRELGALEAGERIDYFYSDAMLDIRDGFYFVSDRRVVVFKGDGAQALISVRFDEIAEVRLDREESFFLDSQITLELSDGQIVAFPLSSEHEGDVRFLERVRERIGVE